MRSSRGLCRVLLALAYLFQVAFGFGLLFSSTTLPSQTPQRDARLDGKAAIVNDNTDQQTRPKIDPWLVARKELRDPECCVVSVYKPKANNNTTIDSSNNNSNNNNSNPLAAHLAVLEERLADKGPSDIDMRVRIDTKTMDSAVRDCLGVCESIQEAYGGKYDDDNNVHDTAQSLATFSMGMASFAEDCLDSCTGVFLRIVCASSYSAHDPVFHTDKAPLRGYVTLKGVGTEFVTHPCSMMEYVGLRSLGLGQDSRRRVRQAAETEFIVMKGDYYYHRRDASVSSWWQRAFACVHRSPPGVGGRRVILSFDLADGDDDREWYDVHQKRQWRAGMTQRKSKLVA